MIATISGAVGTVGKDHVILNVGGLGLRIFAPRSVLESAGRGGYLTLYTHLAVREKDLALYGFESEEDLKLFEILLGVNGVGPKVGVAILSTLSPEILKSAIIREETNILQRVPGIGKKTAERIMFSLRDKLDMTADVGAIPLVSDVDADVIDFLTSLGFSIVEAQSALQNIPRDVTGIDNRVQMALKYLGQSQ